jgi:hypothetical protein
MGYEIADGEGDGFERRPTAMQGFGANLRLGQSLSDKLIQALAARHRFERNLSVNLGRQPYHEFPAETPVCGPFWQWFSINEQKFNPLLDDNLQLIDDVRFGSSVTALSNQRRGTANIALIIVAPFDDLEVTTRGFFDLDGCWFHDWHSVMALRTSFS